MSTDDPGRRYDNGGSLINKGFRDNRSRESWSGAKTGYGGYDGEYGGYGGYSHGGRQPAAPTMPKGYTRSDERIREDVCEHLSRSGLDVREVSVDVAAGHVTLQGTVHDRHAKHAIENCADECIGVQDIDNRIRVQR